MAALVNANFDGATSGEATAATTGATLVTGSAANRQHSTAQIINGAALAATGTTAAVLVWTLSTSRTTTMTRLYVRRENTSTAAGIFCRINQPGGSVNAAQLGFAASTGALTVGDNVTVRASYATNVGQWYRVDWSVTSGVGQTVRLYTGATLHSANTADAVAGGAPLTYSPNNMGDVRVGVVVAVAAAWNIYLDEMVVDNATMPAPFVPPAAGRRLERKVAGAWVPHTVERKVGGLWVPQIVERKDAGVWS